MPNIYSLSFDSEGWKKVQDSAGQIIWQYIGYKVIVCPEFLIA
jgi:hypothetical protein